MKNMSIKFYLNGMIIFRVKALQRNIHTGFSIYKFHLYSFVTLFFYHNTLFYFIILIFIIHNNIY